MNLNNQTKHMKQSTKNIIVFILSGILFAFASVYCYSFYQFDGSKFVFSISIFFGLGTLLSIYAIIEENINPQN
jgi:hypothetical protein